MMLKKTLATLLLLSGTSLFAAAQEPAPTPQSNTPLVSPTNKDTEKETKANIKADKSREKADKAAHKQQKATDKAAKEQAKADKEARKAGESQPK